MKNTHRGHNQSRSQHAHGRGHGPVAQRHALTKHDVKRPTNARREGEKHAQGVKRCGCIAPGQRQQQRQARDGQCHPEPVAGFFRGPDGHAQRANELDGDRHAKGDGLDGAVKQQVHHAQRDAVEAQGQRIGPHPLAPPGPEHGHQHQHGKNDAVSGGALSAQSRKQAFGKRGADRQGHQADQQGQHGPQTQVQTAPLSATSSTMGWP